MHRERKETGDTGERTVERADMVGEPDMRKE